MGLDETNRKGKVSFIKITAAALCTRVLMMLTTFGAAGSISYWQGWVFSGISVLRIFISSAVFINKTELIEERAHPGPGTLWWDKLLYAIYVPLLIATIIIGSLDAGRFGWSPPLPVPVYILNLLINSLAFCLNLWAMWTNRFFSSTVRIQTDRGHKVVQNGPYRFIRHPGNLGVILLEITGCLVLGSLWALVPAGAIVLVVVIRTDLEDRFLKVQLPGYREYSRQVRYKILPGIW